jgi:ComF family protein
MNLLKHIQALSNNVINLFFPSVCVSCHRLLLDNETLLCHHCQSDLPFTYFNLDDDNPLYKRLSTIVNIEAASSLLLFDKADVVKELIHHLKYRGRQDVGQFLGEILSQNLKNNPVVSQIDYIVPAPLHPKKQRKRGYNQLTVFGQTLAKHLQIQYRADILLKTVNNTSQTTKTAEQRRQNVAGVYTVNKPENYANKHFLVIDDVMTTGATIEACAETLLQQIPNAKVSVLTMAVVL